MIKDYGLDVQRLFLEMMLEDASSYVRIQNIYNPENFDRSLRKAAEFIKEHSDKHKTMPDRLQISATTGVKLAPVPDLNQGHYDWFMQEFEAFTKRQELERAILKAADLLEKGEFDPVEKLIKDAVQISLTKDMGTDYFADPSARINKYFNSGGQVSTGWPQLDKLLYGGFSRGELNIFAGGSGSGKSLVMMNIALNWLQQGLSGVYVSLELSEELTSLRTDAMLTSMSTRDIRKDIEGTELRVKMVGKKSGQYRVKGLPAQSNVNDIRSYLKEVQIQTGIKVDFVMIDYLDLVMPVSVKVNPNDQFIKDKYVSEELRNLAKELGILMVTASQLNRSAVEETLAMDGFKQQALTDLKAQLDAGTMSIQEYDAYMRAMGETTRSVADQQKRLADTVDDFKSSAGDRLQRERDQAELQGLTGLRRELRGIELEEQRLAESAKKRIAEQFPDGVNSQQQIQAIKEIDRAMKESIQSRSELAEEIYNQQRTFSYGWQKAFEEYADDAGNAAKTAQKVFQQTTRGMEDAIVGFAKTGKFEWKSFVADIAETILRANVQKLIAGLFGGAMPGGNQGYGNQGQSSGGGFLGDLFGGFFATGGMIPPGRFGIVGESGPEYVSGPANVTPIGSTQVTYNINAVDAASFRQLVARDPAFIHAVAQQGARTIPGSRR